MGSGIYSLLDCEPNGIRTGWQCVFDGMTRYECDIQVIGEQVSSDSSDSVLPIQRSAPSEFKGLNHSMLSHPLRAI